MAIKLPQIPEISGPDVSAAVRAIKEIIDVRNGQRSGARDDRFVTASELNSELIPAYLRICDEQAANTAGGTFTSGAWQTRALNTISSQVDVKASLNSNQILLEAGVYLCRIACPAYAVNRHKARLRNMTDGTDLLLGTSEFAGTAAQTMSVIIGRIDLSSQKVIEVQHRCETTVATDGFGRASNFSVTEVYTVAEFWRQRSA